MDHKPELVGGGGYWFGVCLGTTTAVLSPDPFQAFFGFLGAFGVFILIYIGQYIRWVVQHGR